LGDNRQEISCKGIELTKNHFIQIENMDNPSLIRIPYFAKIYNPSTKDIYLPKGNWLTIVFNENGEKVCTNKFKL